MILHIHSLLHTPDRIWFCTYIHILPHPPDRITWHWVCKYRTGLTNIGFKNPRKPCYSICMLVRILLNSENIQTAVYPIFAVLEKDIVNTVCIIIQHSLLNIAWSTTNMITLNTEWWTLGLNIRKTYVLSNACSPVTTNQEYSIMNLIFHYSEHRFLK
jgi:hypothetical protein